MIKHIAIIVPFLSFFLYKAEAITYEGKAGPGAGKHIVLISGDEEYRSEESLPMLGKILSQRHGFKCTVLFPINKKIGEIDPNTLDNIPGLESLETADLMLVNLRFRSLPAQQMKYIDNYLQKGKPVIGIRPSVVAFKKSSPEKYPQYKFNHRLRGGFGLHILGADWLSHHGRHGYESTLGIPVGEQSKHPVLRGVGKMWGPTDVYEVKNPDNRLGTVLVNGQIIKGMKKDSPLSNKSDMPLAWCRHYDSPAGKGRVFMTTMGDAKDFEDENLRRLLVNACYWAVGLEDKIPAKADVTYVDLYIPTAFGFNKFVKGRKPSDHTLGKIACMKGCCTGTLASTVTQKDTDAIFAKNNHICFIGNTLADRMQHHGWTESYLQAQFPDKVLRFRNLGFPADELATRPRSVGFGSPDVHLSHSKADVVFAFFGYNESFNDEKGLANFKKELAKFIKHTRSQKYNGKSAPELVLFSPIAHEDIDDPNLPDGKENNVRLILYSKAMAQVARELDVPFVDLFTPTLKLYDNHDKPLTHNGIHLNNLGYKRLGQVISKALTGKNKTPKKDHLEKIQEAVLVRNLRWFNRYRATDGYSTYGGRADLMFVDGQTNRDVMNRELEILDVMTANRDKRIWSIAQGKDAPIDDSNLPKPLQVKSNVADFYDSGKRIKGRATNYLDGQEAIKKMKVHQDMEVRLFASEKEFPELVNPVQMAFDPDGRMWVAAWHTYPHWNPLKPLNDKLLIFPDENNDGKADRCIVFADKLHNPTGFEFWKGGVIVACQPEILFLKDTDGDGKADVRVNLLSGIDSADTHCGANSFVYGKDGYLYFSEGIFHYTNIETPWGRPLRAQGEAVYRFNPRTLKIEKHFHIAPNPHGIVIDDWGRLFATDATSGRGYYVGYPKAGVPHELYRKRVRPVAGFGQITGSHFAPERDGNLLICNVIGFRGILQHKIDFDGADIKSKEIEPIVVSTDPNFRPVDVEVGADGAMYFLDWHNVVIGHLQHNLRDPSRDNAHGRIYQVVEKRRPLNKVIKMSNKSVTELVNLLSSGESNVRYRARLALSGKDTDKVLQAAQKLADTLDIKNPDHALTLTELLWLHQQHNRINRQLLLKVLGSPVAEARSAATKVIGQWGEEHLDDGAKLLQKLAADADAKVRAEALVAAPEFSGMDAVEVLFIAHQYPVDAQIAYNIEQTSKLFHPRWSAALAQGQTLSAAGQEFLKIYSGSALDEDVSELIQDGAKNVLNFYYEQAKSKKSYQLLGIQFKTKASKGAQMHFYQLRPDGENKYQTINVVKHTAGDTIGTKKIIFDEPWDIEPSDLLAHSGNGGPAYRLVANEGSDLLYYPVAVFPSKDKSYDLTQINSLPQKRRYVLEFITQNPEDKKADVVIKAVPEKLKYDLSEFTVKAGKKFTLRFENPDNMPHNIVFIQQGAKEEVGLLADKMAADPEAAKNHYVPHSSKVLFATPIVDDHAKVTLEFTAPAKPGEYPFICTFPGHWRVMQGIMKVVK